MPPPHVVLSPLPPRPAGRATTGANSRRKLERRGGERLLGERPSRGSSLEKEAATRQVDGERCGWRAGAAGGDGYVMATCAITSCCRGAATSLALQSERSNLPNRVAGVVRRRQASPRANS